MTVTVPHGGTREGTIGVLDRTSDELLAGAGNKNVQIVDPKKTWDGPVMSFSFTGRVGFISVPLTGTVAVDDTNITVECDLPAMVKNFVGEDKVRGMVEEKLRSLAR